MEDYQSKMIFFRNAGMVCLCIGAAALIIALVLFFLFDIRTILMVRTGLRQKAVPLPYTQMTKEKHRRPDRQFRIVRRTIITDTEETISLL